MINGSHTIIYAEDAERARAFFRDVLELPYVDAHGGWLIFKLPPAELGMHPSDASGVAARHELYLMCDDISATVEDLRAKGVEFIGEVQDEGFGLLIHLKVPGAGELGMYQPRHPTAYDL